MRIAHVRGRPALIDDDGFEIARRCPMHLADGGRYENHYFGGLVADPAGPGGPPLVALVDDPDLPPARWSVLVPAHDPRLFFGPNLAAPMPARRSLPAIERAGARWGRASVPAGGTP